MPQAVPHDLEVVALLSSVAGIGWIPLETNVKTLEMTPLVMTVTVIFQVTLLGMTLVTTEMVALLKDILASRTEVSAGMFAHDLPISSGQQHTNIGWNSSKQLLAGRLLLPPSLHNLFATLKSMHGRITLDWCV